MQPRPVSGLAAALACLLATAGSAPAFAHAIILAATPAPDATLRGGDLPVVLRFNSRIDHERSRLSLLRPDNSALILPLDDGAGPDTLASHLAGLAAGHYRLRWQVLGLDGHITRGEIPFEMMP